MRIKAFGFIALALLLVASAFGATTLPSTTLSAAITSPTDRCFSVTSAASFAVGYLAVVDAEAIQVSSVSGTRVCGMRGAAGTRAATHASAQTIYVGPNHYFTTYDRAGTCSSTNEAILPQINVSNGFVWECTGSVWTLAGLYGLGSPYSTDILTNKYVGAAATGVTAVEYGTSRNHSTKLTFSALALSPATTNAEVGMGVLLYTLPAGAVVVKASYISVALAGSGTADDNDAPDVGIGTTVASGAHDLLSEVAGSENIMTGQTATDCAGTVTTTAVGTVLAVPTAGDHTVYLNAADGWAGVATISATGTVVLEWAFLN